MINLFLQKNTKRQIVVKTYKKRKKYQIKIENGKIITVNIKIKKNKLKVFFGIKEKDENTLFLENKKTSIHKV